MALEHATVRADATQDAAAPRRCRLPLLPLLCLSDHLDPLYPLDMAASPRMPCTRLETTPPAAMAADALHGHPMLMIAPVPQLMCQDHHQDPLARLLRLAIIALPLRSSEHRPDERPVRDLRPHGDPI